MERRSARDTAAWSRKSWLLARMRSRLPTIGMWALRKQSDNEFGRGISMHVDITDFASDLILDDGIYRPAGDVSTPLS